MEQCADENKHMPNSVKIADAFFAVKQDARGIRHAAEHQQQDARPG